jgi:hypothetical protein
MHIQRSDRVNAQRDMIDGAFLISIDNKDKMPGVDICLFVKRSIYDIVKQKDERRQGL